MFITRKLQKIDQANSGIGSIVLGHDKPDWYTARRQRFVAYAQFGFAANTLFIVRLHKATVLFQLLFDFDSNSVSPYSTHYYLVVLEIRRICENIINLKYFSISYQLLWVCRPFRKPALQDNIFMLRVRKYVGCYETRSAYVLVACKGVAGFYEICYEATHLTFLLYKWKYEKLLWSMSSNGISSQQSALLVIWAL